MRPPRPHPFLAAEASAPGPGADAVIVGFATDGGVSFRGGAADGPRGIREYSESIESFSPRCGRDLEDLRLLDAGDHEGGAGVEEAAGAVMDACWKDGRRALLVSIGGDHSVTPPIVRAAAARLPGLALVGLDAHLDLREDYPGDHACTYRRVADAGVPAHVLGVRSGARSEWEDAPHVLASHRRGLDVVEILPGLERRPVYLTVDIDVLDPSAAPGTGNPEPGGPGFDELLGALEALMTLDVAAVDVVEVSPPLDASGITQAAAAVLIRELTLRSAG